MIPVFFWLHEGFIWMKAKPDPDTVKTSVCGTEGLVTLVG